MKDLELEMVLLLKKMKKSYGVCEVKAEFEAEAVRIHEAMRLKDIAEKAELGIVLKIGGAEAITDMFEAQHIGVTGLVAPMVESAYAMKKFLEAINYHFPEDLMKRIIFGVNIETYTAYQNLKEILRSPNLELIGKITLGRVDMSGSLGISREEINSPGMYKIAEDMFEQVKKKRLKTAMGGGIAKEAIPFIQKLVRKGLLDYYETRKIVFKTTRNSGKIEEGIILANEFELLWLRNKNNYYERICHEDDKRLKMLQKRISFKFPRQ